MIDKIFNDWKQIGNGTISMIPLSPFGSIRRTIPTIMIDENLWTKVEMKSNNLTDEVFIWLKEMKLPCIIVSSTDSITKFWFVKEEDATLFKMTW